VLEDATSPDYLDEMSDERGDLVLEHLGAIRTDIADL
jgi:hypothetical protein